MQTQTIAEARELISFAIQTIVALRSAGDRLSSSPDTGDERSWMESAARRIQRRTDDVHAALASAAALPEFEAERQARAQELFEAWVNAAEALHAGLCTHASPLSPLIEVLFPHQKFDKLRRGGASARGYMAELDRRRRTAYVVRLSAEPEYAFLPPLLAELDARKLALQQHEAPITATDEELAALRAAVFAQADTLRVELSRARLLAEAALLDHPGWFGELGLDAKPRKRAPRAVSAGSDAP